MRADRKAVARLLKTARGQIDGILKMIEEDRYCVDVSNQLMATQSILTKANREILKAHISGCVQEAFDSGDEAQREASMQEILALLDKLGR
ncbi:MAG: metal-sensing transcriptional repressor [Subdoligranulum sp.]|nr:metal-sensing transcriptional repressor [Subdoligranulum sp.]MBD5101112.1 metal-sensing transcriptional repressor [Subdoligranulum sp.]